MLDVVVEGIAIPDAFKRQPGSKRNEFRQTRMREPNRSFILEARKEPRASAANWGNVIMHGLKACCTIIVDQWLWVNSRATTTAERCQMPTYARKSQWLAPLHDGLLTSEQGQGSVFTVRLPGDATS